MPNDKYRCPNWEKCSNDGKHWCHHYFAHEKHNTCVIYDSDSPHFTGCVDCKKCEVVNE